MLSWKIFLLLKYFGINKWRLKWRFSVPVPKFIYIWLDLLYLFENVNVTWSGFSTTVSQKRHPFYFLNNSVKIHRISIIFGTHRR